MKRMKWVVALSTAILSTVIIMAISSPKLAVRADSKPALGTEVKIDNFSFGPDAFADREPMQPETILSWFYPGRTSGHQFVYSKVEEQEIAQVKHHTEMVKELNKNQTAVVGD